MIHQPWGGASGSSTDISIQANEIMRLKDAKRRNRGWLPNHTTTCDDSYQDRLELLWEIRDIENNLDEMEAEINRLKTIAKL